MSRSSRDLAAILLTAALAASIALAADPPPPGDPPAAAAAPLVASTAPPSVAPPADDVTPVRVIVRPDRFTEVRGTLEEDGRDFVVIRTLDGEVTSFSRARVLQIIRLVDPTPAQRRGTVYLRSGDVRVGDVVEDSYERVVLEIEGIRTVIPRAAVDFVELDPTFDERYAHFKAIIKPEQAQRHFALCEWLYEERRYELAAKELADLVARHDLYEAKELAKVVDAQLALRTRPRPAVEPEPREPEPSVDLPSNLLSNEDVNVMRVYEIDMQRPPEVVVPRDTIDKLLRVYAENPLIPADHEARKRIYSADPLDIVQLMFKLRARDLYSEIDVLTEPYALNLFRQRVHDAWLMNNCATSRCHGGPDAGPLFLHGKNARQTRVRYTNLLILERLEIDPDWPLINYERPLDSLIIQMGLPRTMARRPHPPARGWTPSFRRPTDRSVRATVQWIDSMLRPRLEYPVEYALPKLPGRPGDPDAERTGR